MNIYTCAEHTYKYTYLTYNIYNKYTLTRVYLIMNRMLLPHLFFILYLDCMHTNTCTHIA